MFFDPYEPQDFDADVHINLVGTDDLTVAEVSLNIDFAEKIKITAGSKRDPGDPVNHEIGTKLALGRALRQLGRELLRDAQEGVREQAKVKQSQEEAAAAARVKKEQRKAEIKAQVKAKSTEMCIYYTDKPRSECSICAPLFLR